jgi:hypothetical protein
MRWTAPAWFTAGLLLGWAFVYDRSTEPQITWGTEHGVLVTTSPRQGYQAIELAAQHCARWPADSRDPRRRKYAVVTEITARTTGTMRFDCIPHSELTGPLGLVR